MATLYFGWPAGQYAGFWDTLSNWFTDSACTIPAAALPTINDHVVIQPQPGAALSSQGGPGVVVIQYYNATAASITLIDTRPLGIGNFYLSCGFDYFNFVPNTLTVSGNITSSGVVLYNQGAIVCGGTITLNSPVTPGSVTGLDAVLTEGYPGMPSSITCSQLILNDARLYPQGDASIVGNVQCNNTQVSVSGIGHVLSRTNSLGLLCHAVCRIFPPEWGAVISITGNLTLNNGYSVVFGLHPKDFSPTYTFTHAGFLVTGNVTMTKTSLFCGEATGTGYMDIDSLVAAHKYQGYQGVGPVFGERTADIGVYGGGVVAVYDKGINGSSILGVV